MLAAAEELAGVDVPRPPNKGFAVAGAEVEAELPGALVVAPPESPANILETVGAVEDVVAGLNPGNNPPDVVAGAALDADVWVLGVLAAGKLKVGFGASEAGAVVEAVSAPELAGVEVALLNSPPLGAGFPPPRPENNDGLG